MADVTVKELADVVNIGVDRLLSQMKEAGLPQTGSEDAVSDDQKQTLLAFLKSSHGESGDAPEENYPEAQSNHDIKSGCRWQEASKRRSAQKAYLREAR